MTAAPAAAPGAGPKRYQPTSLTSSGTTMAPLASTPTGSRSRRCPRRARPGARVRGGRVAPGWRAGCGGRAGRQAWTSPGARPGGGEPDAVGAGAPTDVTGTPSSAEGRVRARATARRRRGRGSRPGAATAAAHRVPPESSDRDRQGGSPRDRSRRSGQSITLPLVLLSVAQRRATTSSRPATAAPPTARSVNAASGSGRLSSTRPPVPGGRRRGCRAGR